MKSDDVVARELEQAAEGLMLMSESDYPFEIVRWNGLSEITPRHLLSVSGQPSGTSVEAVSVGDFFGAATTAREGQGPEARERVERFQRLVEILKADLAGVKAYKVGAINMPVYIVGRSMEGNWLGLSTRVVET